MSPLTHWFESLTRRNWKPEQLQRYMGTVQSAALSYAAEPALRERSASGGAVTAILLHLLESGAIDGALVNEAYVESGVVKSRFLIAQDRESLLRAQGSKYLAVRFSAGAVPLIRAFEGKLAVVALPCDAALLRNLCGKDEGLAAKVQCLIALFCGHNSEPGNVNHAIGKITKNVESPLSAFQSKSGLWRGQYELSFQNGMKLMMPSHHFKTYQNLYFFCERKCLNCHDHFGYAADISAGDLWLSEMEKESIKRTALLMRTERGSGIVQDAAASADLVRETVSPVLVMQGQARTARCHYNVSARHRVGKLLGIKIPDDVKTRVTFVDWLVAFIVVFNYKLSTTKYGRKLIYALPKTIWKLYLYGFKGLESL